ncbi:MAG: hypothetical protein ACR2LI_00670 [Propionibacteriaceae bacterium]
MPDEPLDEIDVRNNPESRAGAADTSSYLARASDGGMPPKDGPEAGELPQTETGGTADGDPLAGVTISEADQAAAVSGDTGPNELNDGPTMRGGA